MHCTINFGITLTQLHACELQWSSWGFRALLKGTSVLVMREGPRFIYAITFQLLIIK